MPPQNPYLTGRRGARRPRQTQGRRMADAASGTFLRGQPGRRGFDAGAAYQPQDGSQGFQGGGGGGSYFGQQAPQAPQAAPQGTQAAPGLPLDPVYEAGRRMASDRLTQALSQIGAARGEVDPAMQLQLARLGTNEGVERRLTNEGANARGIFNSSIRGDDLAQVSQGYGRRRQDLTTDVARQYRDLAGQESQAQLGYQQTLADLLLELANRSAQDPSAPALGDLPYDQAPLGPPGMGPGGPLAGGGKRKGGKKNKGKGKKKNKGKGGK